MTFTRCSPLHGLPVIRWRWVGPKVLRWWLTWRRPSSPREHSLRPCQFLWTNHWKLISFIRKRWWGLLPFLVFQGQTIPYWSQFRSLAFHLTCLAQKRGRIYEVPIQKIYIELRWSHPYFSCSDSTNHCIPLTTFWSWATAYGSKAVYHLHHTLPLKIFVHELNCNLQTLECFILTFYCRVFCCF